MGSSSQGKAMVFCRQRLVDLLSEGNEEPFGGGQVVAQLPDTTPQREAWEDLEREVAKILDR